MLSELDYNEECVIIVEVYKDKLVGQPFVKSAVLTNLDKTFLELLRTTLSKEKPDYMYNDTNVTSCSTQNGTSMTALISSPLSLLLQVIQSNQLEILRFVIKITHPQLLNQSKTPNIFDDMIRNANSEIFLNQNTAKKMLTNS